ncbi:MAG: Flp pilus assembly protein CpaB [Actinobacteria bacterium]|nr:Flp pilus assembly protein CpaB [Actinomycetota bacterium]
MNYRVKNIGIAVALAALAAILTSVYVVNYKRHVQHGEGKVTVLVAARDIPVGTSGADVIDKKMLKQQTVPRKVRVPGAISSPDQLSQYVAIQDIFQGEQVSSRRFAAPQEQGIRAKIKGTQRAYQLPGNGDQLLAGTLQVGDHVDVVGTWEVKTGTGGDGSLVSRVVLRDLLVLTAPQGTSSSTVASGSGGMSVQLRVTDAQSQKLLWIQKNGVDGGFHLELRPPSSSLDTSNTYQDSRLMLSDGPGRRP